MKDLGITKSECHIVDYAGYKLLQSGEFYGDKDLLNESEYIEAEANAVLFKDSFDTAQKCGLLPSELLKQRDDLRRILFRICKDAEITALGEVSNFVKVPVDSINNGIKVINDIK